MALMTANMYSAIFEFQMKWKQIMNELAQVSFHSANLMLPQSINFRINDHTTEQAC